MKRILYILATLVLGAVGCSKSTIDEPKVKGNDKVELVMSLQMPPVALATKAGEMSTLPTIESIRVALFGTAAEDPNGGYLQDYVLATPCTSNGTAVTSYATTNGDTYYFKVILPVYDADAVVHVIANGPANLTFGREKVVMPGLETEGNRGAFWQRIELPNGILGKTEMVDGVYQFKRTNSGYIDPTDATIAAFTNITLVRNFAEIALKTTPGDNGTNASLRNIQFALVYEPTKGTIPIIGSNGAYITDYSAYEYAQPNTTGFLYKGSTIYPGYQVTTTLTAAPTTETMSTIKWVDAGASDFMFERLKPTESPTCLLMRGKFVTGTTVDEDYSYYRVDLMREEVGGYFPIYRNYRYTITIGTVGNRGSSTVEDAMLRNSGGNVSMSMEAQNLTDISDGIGRLYVEYIDKNYIAGGEKSFRLMYIPDVTADEDEDGNADVDNSKVTIGDVVTASGDPAIQETKLTKGDEVDGWQYYSYTATAQSETADKVSTFQVVANNGKSGTEKSVIYRTITVRVLKKQQLVLSLNPESVDQELGAKTTLGITLPTGLDKSLFPLIMIIEDSNKTINPSGTDGADAAVTVPVELGKSIVPGKEDENSFHFVRTINSSEYEAAIDAASEGATTVTINTEFKTLISASATTIYVQNEYFNPNSVELRNNAVARYRTVTFTTADFDTNDLTQTRDGATATFSYISEKSDFWGYIQLTNNNTARTLTISAASPATAITEISINYYTYDRRGTVNVTSGGGSYTDPANRSPYSGVWAPTAGNDVTSVVFSIQRRNNYNNSNVRIASISVTYKYYE